MSLSKTKQRRPIYSYEDILSSSIQKINSQHNGSTVIVPHVCNNINLFGAGFAAYIGNRYPIVKENFHMLGNKSKLGHVQYITIEKEKTYHHELIVANMIAQNKVISHTNRRPLNYEALVVCMINIRNYVSNLKRNDQDVEIHCPKFGSGLSGGNWNLIEYLIEDIWSNQKVFVYNYPNKSGLKNE
jgi:hypothetical protein